MKTGSYENTDNFVLLKLENSSLTMYTYICIGHWICIAKYRIVFAVGTSEICSGARILKRTLRIAHEFSQEETVLHGLWPHHSGSGSECSGIGLRSGQVNS